MALPKEPRQKMINLMYLVLTALLALNVSAEVIEAFRTIDNSLQNSNKSIESSNAILFESLDAAAKDQQTATRAAIWAPVANNAKVEADKMISYLEGLKDSLKVASDLKKDANGKPILNEKGEEDYRLDDLNASSRLMDEEKKGTDLDNMLKAFRAAIMANPEVKAHFEKTLAVEAEPNSTPNFRMMPTVAAITLLSKYQNNVRNAENQVVSFAQEQIGKVKVVYNQFAAIVGQSSNYVMPGEKISITAGVGAFSTESKPEISIGGASAPVDADGVATKEFTADGGGERSVPVHVTYTKPDGTKESKDYTMKYTVGTPGGASVMLDKMNVFYIGVDNPVTIGSPKGMDKTNVSMTGGTISQGSSPNRTVRVTALGAASITINAEGSAPKTYQFRVRRIPDPVFKVGDGKARMAAVAFKSQQFCRADLGDDFLFDLKFNVVSATVYFSGANFPNVTTGQITGNSLAGISAMIQRCGPGSSITFVNIKVQGPDGVRTIDERGITLY